MKMSQKDIDWRIKQLIRNKFNDLSDFYKNPSGAKKDAFDLCLKNLLDIDSFNSSTSIWGVVAGSTFAFTFIGLTEKVLFVATRDYNKVVDLETREITFI